MSGSVPARSFAFLVNPVSGGGAGPRVVVPLARRLRELGADVDVTYTSSPSQVPALVKDAVAAGRVVASVGGDGMLSSVAGEVAAADGVLAIVPAGRGNDFARMLQVPTEEDALVELLLSGEPRPLDLLEVVAADGSHQAVAGSVYVGVDARAGQIVDRSRWLPSRLQYPFAAVGAIVTYRPVACTVEVDGERRDYTAATVVVANSAYYGKGMQIAPPADVADGLLDVVVIEATKRLDLLRALPKVYDGRHVELDEVTVLRGRSVRVSGTYAGSGGAVPVGADGEALADLPGDGAEPLTVTVRPSAVRIVCPT